MMTVGCSQHVDYSRQSSSAVVSMLTSADSHHHQLTVIVGCSQHAGVTAIETPHVLVKTLLVVLELS